MNSGVVRTVKLDRGFGFLRTEGRDLFFHMTGCITDFFDLKPGDQVSFDVDDKNRKGPRAINIEKIPPAA